jgi:hypothetical protein
LSVAPGADSVFVDWGAATDNVAVSHYVVKLYGEGKRSTAKTSLVWSGLDPGTEYHVAVWAVDVFGNSGKRKHAYFTTAAG